MQKIFVEKDDIIAEIIERILEVEDREVTLVIPKGSRLAESLSNFRLLAREEKALEKRLIIESVDEEVLSFAKSSKLEALHPLFGEGEGRSLSDILPREEKKKTKALSKKKGGRHEAEVSEREEAGRKLEVRVEEEVLPEEDAIQGEEVPEEDSEYAVSDFPRKKKLSRRIVFWCLLLLVVALGGAYVAGAFFSRAKITLRFEKTPWEHTGAFTASVGATKSDIPRSIIPAQLFEETKTATQFFPATGRSTSSEKARGKITVLNAYSSAPQTLVATTRFETPDGKIYRLDSQIVVPGAKITNGKIEPASSKADVTADKPGPEFNVGRVERLSIPGFKGSAKFNGFYGVLEDGTSGGSLGDRPVPSDGDVTKGREKTEEVLRSAFQITFLSVIPGEFKVPSEASLFSVSKMVVNRTVDTEGNFSILGSAAFKALAFREGDLAIALEAKASGDDSEKMIEGLSLTYTDIRPDFTKKTLSFSVAARGNITSRFSADAWKSSILGKSEADAEKTILALPGLVDAKVSLWPKWLSSLPADAQKVTVVVE